MKQFSFFAAAVIAFFVTAPAKAEDPFTLAQSAAHKLKVIADGGSKWCGAKLSLRMILEADSPDIGNANSQIEIMNRLKGPIEAACAAASSAELAVLEQDKPQGSYRAAKSEGWVFKGATSAAATGPASLDTPAEQQASATPKPAAAQVAAVPATQPGDFPGSHDPAFLKRYEGSKIIGYLTQPYDRYSVAQPDPTKPPSGYQFVTTEGQITRIVYQTTPGHTPLELLRNYQAAIDEAGFSRSLELTEREVEARGFGCKTYLQGWQVGEDWYDLSCAGIKQLGYVSAKGNKDGKDITLAVLVVNFYQDRDMTYQGQKRHFDPTQVTVVVDVVAAKAVDIKMVLVKAADIADALASKGMIDLYGILFDTDKSDIKPESDKTLEEVANVLKIDRSLKLEVSGHTDNSGDKDHNQKLSEGRAQAVVDALVKKYAIDPSRLQAKGYGDSKPVAPNDSDANKAKNRRVELRKM